MLGSLDTDGDTDGARDMLGSSDTVGDTEGVCGVGTDDMVGNTLGS